MTIVTSTYDTNEWQLVKKTTTKDMRLAFMACDTHYMASMEDKIEAHYKALIDASPKYEGEILSDQEHFVACLEEGARFQQEVLKRFSHLMTVQEGRTYSVWDVLETVTKVLDNAMRMLKKLP